jgi:hypothetical protein
MEELKEVGAHARHAIRCAGLPGEAGRGGGRLAPTLFSSQLITCALDQKGVLSRLKVRPAWLASPPGAAWRLAL